MLITFLPKNEGSVFTLKQYEARNPQQEYKREEESCGLWPKEGISKKLIRFFVRQHPPDLRFGQTGTGYTLFC